MDKDIEKIENKAIGNAPENKTKAEIIEHYEDEAQVLKDLLNARDNTVSELLQEKTRNVTRIKVLEDRLKPTTNPTETVNVEYISDVAGLTKGSTTKMGARDAKYMQEKGYVKIVK